MLRNAKRITTVATCLALLAVLLPASGQATSAEVVSLPRGFIGAGVAVADSADESSRMRRFDDASSRIWTIEAGFAFSPRVGVGVELIIPSAVVATSRGMSFHESGRQEERLLLGLVRVRAAGSARWGFDVVGGAGVLFQRHERQFAPCFRGCENIIDETLDNQAPAFALGAEVPFLLLPQFAVSPFARLYVLRRGQHISRPPVTLPWQYEWTSSTRIALGITGRFVW